jgi:thiamine biosynthesis lipoprotein
MATDVFFAMGTEIAVVADDPEVFTRVRDEFAAIEAACSRFRPDSDLERLNDAPGEIALVPEALAGVLAAASDLRDRTGGLVDAGLGSAVIAWGYDRTFSEIGPVSPPERLASPSWRVEGRRLFRGPGTRLDLGGIAKGWAADRVVEAGWATVAGAGGDIRSADPGTVVEVFDPWDRVAARVALGIGGLATSSVGRRRWDAGGEEAHHLIDPRTLQPARTPVVSATAVAATAVEAEAAAKAVLLLGEEGLAWADDAPWVAGAIVVWADGRVFATRGLDLEAA